MREEYNRRRQLICSGLNAMGLKTSKPGGASTCSRMLVSSGMDDEEYAEKLLYEEHVAVVPGRSFGIPASGLCAVRNATEYHCIEIALERMQAFLKRHRA
jgi:aminotransferase